MKTTNIAPYLFFNGRCEEAIEFYKSAVGAKVDFMMRYKESPESPPPGMVPPGMENKIMHATFHVGESAIMAADDCTGGSKTFEGFNLAIAAPTEADAGSMFTALSAGGAVKMPLTKTFWSPCFGMLTDKFGVGWMVSVQHEQA